MTTKNYYWFPQNSGTDSPDPNQSSAFEKKKVEEREWECLCVQEEKGDIRAVLLTSSPGCDEAAITVDSREV
ncbi:hypothetical protein BDV30DRAFT_231417 [Aspergillus minisclerotigenes]|uniref:Uncharacterized protein n=1 Tax=Aspergillus minisclerotigenes TaxID=656917 RepID=A0A5N6IR55_9EURO|nr:hypothetical protein BDV30DRAFT_231417 [Aspergillus minisclerotigenes]